MRKTLTLILLLLIESASVFAQDFNLTGMVSDKNTTLQGVSVSVKGTQKGTTTDQFGRYNLIRKGDENGQ